MPTEVQGALTSAPEAPTIYFWCLSRIAPKSEKGGEGGRTRPFGHPNIGRRPQISGLTGREVTAQGRQKTKTLL